MRIKTTVWIFGTTTAMTPLFVFTEKKLEWYQTLFFVLFALPTKPKENEMI